MQFLQLGDSGPAVAEVRSRLISLGFLHDDDDITEASSEFDSALDTAIRGFQQQRGLLVDGIVGKATHRALQEAGYRLGARILAYHVTAPQYGDDVAALQTRLQDLGFYTDLIDGFFGPGTHTALSSYQRESGLNVDGICGPSTLRALEMLGARVTGGSPHAILAEEVVRQSGPKLRNKRIIIDPGLGGRNSGVIVPGPRGPISEAEILWDLANRIEGRMGATGMETFLSRPRNKCPSVVERAEMANDLNADLMISLQCGHSESSVAHGVATFHYGVPNGSESTIGAVLAGFLQREIAARTGLLDCRSHGRTWDVLRLTRMPTVQIDIGYITNGNDASLLADPKMRDVVAEAILVAVKRLYLLGKDDQPTGTFTFAELLAHELAVEGRREK
ncbi:peptidoglycan-binding protein [Hoyosella rhizosphaerae]|uniref:N-acetylmuramoyl-L-alanine amidase n=1 Tax=Hoyosella rhizosphaerae TaxID=1755582 RepID=A0A916U9G0_9ACTN|nr:N-acetylmuramoyl-L-alanine amidase [Hoyosella rhizosphaerae]MBN4927489.1 peptidoglycan-binding protein [Hoyosella rhizosphaerae]GGC64068.1 N-acetylmuramoyl-L-alanine amidase [Hoyosella rhizosphaerae]